MSEERYKAYLLVKDTIAVGTAINSCAHAGTAIMVHWSNTTEVMEWLKGPMRKVTCKVTVEQFERAKKSELEHVVTTELALNGEEVVLVFRPRTEWPKEFKFYSLYR